MEIIFEPEAKADLDFWVKSGNKIFLKKVTRLVEDIVQHPFEGI